MNEYPKILSLESFPEAPATVPFSVVLRDLGPNGRCRYATHCRDDRDGSYYWGHYYNDLNAARKDFTERCEKYRPYYITHQKEVHHDQR